MSAVVLVRLVGDRFAGSREVVNLHKIPPRLSLQRAYVQGERNPRG
jgi:hypothetical protein